MIPIIVPVLIGKRRRASLFLLWVQIGLILAAILLIIITLVLYFTDRL